MVDAYSGPIYNLALRMLGHSQDAEDVLQETFLKAFRSLPEFEGRSSLSTWLYRIAVNESLMLLRKHGPETVPVDEEPEEDSAEGVQKPVEILDWCCLPEGELLSSETHQELDKAVQQLSPALRAVFLLRDMQGLSIRETAETLNLSETAVKTRLLRARLRLREILSAYFHERMSEGKRE
jgi:RNA polymerase sigma-70 factor (ECF subfamily)